MSLGDLRIVEPRSNVASRWATIVRDTPVKELGAMVCGTGLVFVGTMVMDRLTAWPRWVCAMAGLYLLWRGIDGLAKRLFGPRFPTGAWLAGAWLLLLVVLAVFAGVLGFESPTALPLDGVQFARPDLFSSHILGTDDFGRDYLSRIVYGARISLVVGFGATLVGGVVGSTIGVLAAYYGKALGAVVDIVTDTLLAFPPLVFLLALVAVLQPSEQTEFVALAALTVPAFVRLARSATYGTLSQEYVTAARALGATDRRIMFREIVPNVTGPLLSYAMVIVATLVVAESSLSFLGLGIQSPQPSWGNMIAASQSVFQQDPHTVLVPAAILFVTVVACNRLGAGGSRARQTATGSGL